MRDKYSPSSIAPIGGNFPTPSTYGRTNVVSRSGILGLNVRTGYYDEVLIDGNDEDFEKPVVSGLLRVDSYSYTYDEGQDTWNRSRGNYGEILLPNAVYAASQVTPVFDNFNSRGGHFIINVSAVPGVDTITPTIWGYDKLTGTLYNLLIGTAISTTGITVLKIYPGIAALANAAASDFLPRNFGFTMTHSAASNFTYSVSMIQSI